MTTKLIFFVAALSILNGPALLAKPSDEARWAFEEGILVERRNFETQVKAVPPGPRTQEIERFNRKRIQDKVALDQRLQGLMPEQKRPLFDDYQKNLQGEIKAHNEKLKKLPVEKNNLQTQRREFERKIAQKTRDFYSQ